MTKHMEQNRQAQTYENGALAAGMHSDCGAQRVAAYCRVSTLAEEQADSYETQCAYYTRLIETDPNMTLVGVYGDPGISGLTMGKRPEFQRLMCDCEAGKVDLVMTKSISRFARNLADCAECIAKLRSWGIPVLFEKEGLNSSEESCEMLLSFLAAMAQEESNNLSRNIRWAKEHRNAIGDPPRRAGYGYQRGKDDNGKLVWKIHEPEAKRVRVAFQMAYRGKDYRTILGALNRLEAAEDGGKPWRQDRLLRLLRNEIYIGDVLTDKSVRPDFLSKSEVRNRGQFPQYYIEDHHEPIVKKEVFNSVQDQIRSNTLRTKRKGRC